MSPSPDTALLEAEEWLPPLAWEGFENCYCWASELPQPEKLELAGVARRAVSSVAL